MAATSQSQHEQDEGEDVALVEAIREGESSGLVSRNEVFRLLDSPASIPTTVTRTYRPGAIGALMDEYERAAAELASLVGRLDEEAFARVRDPLNSDLESIQAVMRHVVRAGYIYADYLRSALGIPAARPEIPLARRDEALAQFSTMLAYTVETLEGRWEMTDDEILAARIDARWRQTYDAEGLMEHAVVHVLRHRRQIERFLASPP